MSSLSLFSSASSAPQPKIRPPTLIPQVDLTALAKTTRKTLERLVPFSHMRPSASETSPKPTKIINKINHYISLIDSSILCVQLGYQLANNCMILCDPELCAGLSTPTVGNVRITTRGPGGAWTPVGISRQPGAADTACIFGREDVCELAGKGYEIALKVKKEFGNITQDIYKIAASTKDDMLLVLVPPDPTHSATLKIHLKDVGTNLVANLSLLSEFSKAVSELTNWWSSVKDDLALEEPALLALTPSQCGDNEQGGRENFAWWSQMKDDFQDYGDAINAVHLRFPVLLPSSSAAWQSVASTRSQAPSPIGLLSNPQSKPGVDPSAGSKGRAHLGSFRMRWKRMDKQKRKEKETKSTITLVKRKELKEKDLREGIEDGKKTKEVKSETRDMTAETDDENNTKQERDRKTMTMKRSFILSCIV